jgi:hypothetical protein
MAGTAVLVVLVLTLASRATVVYADSPSPVETPPPATQPQPAAPQATETPQYTPSGGNVPTGTPAPDPAPTVVNNTTTILHILQIPDTATFGTVITKAFAKQVAALFGIDYNPGAGNVNLQSSAVGAVSSYMEGLAGSKTTSLKNVWASPDPTRENLWNASLRIALVLIPLSLLLMVASAMKEGSVTTTIMGYDNAREAFINWVGSIGLMAASLVILNLLTNGASAISAALIDSLFRGNGWQVVFNEIFGQSLGTMITQINPIAGLFVMFFEIILVFTFITSLLIAMIARDVIILLLAAAAPIVFVLSTFGEFDFMKRTWITTAVMSALMQPINVAVIGIAYSLMANQANITDIGGFLKMTMMLLGIVSVIMSVNSIYGKSVFGAVQEVAQKAGKATMAVVAAAAGVAGAAVGVGMAGGMAGAGAAGGAAEAGAAGAGAAGAGTATGTGGAAAVGAGSTGSAGQALGATAKSGGLGGMFGSGQGSQMMTHALGEALRATGIPGVSNFGQGMMAGSRMASGADQIFQQQSAAAQSLAQGQQKERDESTQPEQVLKNMQPGRDMALSNARTRADFDKAMDRSHKLYAAREGFEGHFPTYDEGVGKAMNAVVASGDSLPTFLEKGGWLQAAGGDVNAATANYLMVGAMQGGFGSTGVLGARPDAYVFPEKSNNYAPVIAYRKNSDWAGDTGYLSQQSHAIAAAQTRGHDSFGNVMEGYDRMTRDERVTWAENVLHTSPGGGVLADPPPIPNEGATGLFG